MLKVRGEAYGTRRKIDHTYTFNNYKTFIAKEEAAHFQVFKVKRHACQKLLWQVTSNRQYIMLLILNTC